MKTNYRLDYLTPKTRVINVNFKGSLMVNSFVKNSSSESFQNESEYESIW